MSNRIFQATILVLFFTLFNCKDARDKYVQIKNACYSENLDRLRSQSLYYQIHGSFVDTFAIMKKAQPENRLLKEKIDDAIFLKSDSTECLLIVLEQYSNATLGLGSARVYKGQRLNDRWKFRKSIWISFAGYSDKYSDNSFENISEVARYSVLTNGEVNTSGCDIDEYFWFEYMKD